MSLSNYYLCRYSPFCLFFLLYNLLLNYLVIYEFIWQLVVAEVQFSILKVCSYYAYKQSVTSIAKDTLTCSCHFKKDHAF